MRAGAEVTLDVGFIHKYGTLALLKPHKPRIGRWHFRGLFETRGHFMWTTREDRVGDWECGAGRAEQQTGSSLAGWQPPRPRSLLRTDGGRDLSKSTSLLRTCPYLGGGPRTGGMPAKARVISYPIRAGKAYALNSTSANRESVNHLRSQ